MVRSMTAFARQTAENELGTLTWELKSVNHRFSEVSLRLPEEIRPLEPKIRDLISSVVNRGKIDANLRYQPPTLQQNGFNLDDALIQALSQAAERVNNQVKNSNPLSIMDIIKWPGVMQTPQVDAEQLSSAVLGLLDLALKELMETREREGEKLKQALQERLTAMEGHVATVKTRIPVANEALRQRMREKLEEWKADLDEGRLEQEVVFLLNKSDVDEEMDRLQAHIEEVSRVLSENKPIGRRLDFLMQELNREANTLSSKSPDTEMTRSSIELKVLIEQMREQVQNIE